MLTKSNDNGFFFISPYQTFRKIIVPNISN